MKLTLAEDLMKKDLTTVMEGDSVVDAIHVIHAGSTIGAIPVVDDHWNLVGTISEEDILQSVLPTYLEILAQSSFLFSEEELLSQKFKEIKDQPVKQFMQTHPTFVSSGTSIMSVADLMIRKGIKSLPVLDGTLLVGVIDRADFCEYLMGLR